MAQVEIRKASQGKAESNSVYTRPSETLGRRVAAPLERKEQLARELALQEKCTRQRDSPNSSNNSNTDNTESKALRQHATDNSSDLLQLNRERDVISQGSAVRAPVPMSTYKVPNPLETSSQTKLETFKSSRDGTEQKTVDHNEVATDNHARALLSLAAERQQAAQTVAVAQVPKRNEDYVTTFSQAIAGFVASLDSMAVHHTTIQQQSAYVLILQTILPCLMFILSSLEQENGKMIPDDLVQTSTFLDNVVGDLRNVHFVGLCNRFPPLQGSNASHVIHSIVFPGLTSVAESLRKQAHLRVQKDETG